MPWKKNIGPLPRLFNCRVESYSTRSHLHECSQRIWILSFDLLDRMVALLLAATREDHVIASFTQMLRYLVAEPRVRARYDDYLPRHCF